LKEPFCCGSTLFLACGSSITTKSDSDAFEVAMYYISDIYGRKSRNILTHHIYPDEFHEITNIHRSEYRISSKSHRHNPWAHYPKRYPGEKSRIIPHTAGCQHRIPECGIRHCWWHFRQRNLRMGFTLHTLTTLRADLRKVCSSKTRCNPRIPETLMDGYMGCQEPG